jgi:predicted phosphodiesterase
MRLALVSDVHANLPALEAVLADIDRRNIRVTYHLGDLVGYAPWPNEVIDLVWERAMPGVSGNYDSTVGTGYKHCGCQYEDPEQEALSHESFAWTCRHTSEASKERLRSLPFRLDLRPAGGHLGGPALVMVHGAPTLNTLYWRDDRSDEFCLQMGRQAGMRPGDLIAFGHTHVAWQREVEGLHFVNTGSVGRPKDGDWRAGYVIVSFDGGWRIEFVRVEYDVERAAQGIVESDLPSAFAQYLRAGGTPARK